MSHSMKLLCALVTCMFLFALRFFPVNNDVSHFNTDVRIDLQSTEEKEWYQVSTMNISISKYAQITTDDICSSVEFVPREISHTLYTFKKVQILETADYSEYVIKSDQKYFGLTYEPGEKLKPVKQCVDEDKVILVGYLWSSIYYHFLFDTLSIVSVYRAYINLGWKIVIHQGSFRGYDFATELAHLTGLDSKSIVSASCINANHVMYPSSRSMHNDGLFFQTLRRQFRENLPSDLNTKIVILKRNDSREIQNFDELVKELAKEFPKRMMVISDDSLPTQIEIASAIRNASVLIGTHGGGMANMIFMQTKSLVVEFKVHGEHFIEMYGRHAQELGISYEQVATDERKHANIQTVKSIIKAHQDCNDWHRRAF